MNKQNETEVATTDSRSAKENIDSYGHHQDIVVVNRDGDLFYIECPECHSTEVHKRTIMACRCCHTHFSLYLEDGIQTMRAITDMGSVHGYTHENQNVRKIVLMEQNKGDYFKKVLDPKYNNEIDLKKLKEAYPSMKLINLYRDLKDDGKDAHGHAKYKRFALIPLD